MEAACDSFQAASFISFTLYTNSMKVYLFAIALIVSKNACCQNTLVHYEVTSQGKISSCELVFNDSFAVFKVKPANPDTKSTNAFFVKNKFEGRVFFSERILNQNVYVKDSIYLMKWELLDDTATILNQACLSATTTFRGRKYIAYYSPQYITDEGPWKFGGLPGLIFAIKSEDNFIEWNATKIIENYPDKISPLDCSDYKFLEWNEFVSQYKQAMLNFIKATKSSGRMANDMNARIKIDAVEIFYPELQTGEGIKF